MDAEFVQVHVVNGEWWKCGDGDDPMMLALNTQLTIIQQDVYSMVIVCTTPII